MTSVSAAEDNLTDNQAVNLESTDTIVAVSSSNEIMNTTMNNDSSEQGGVLGSSNDNNGDLSELSELISYTEEGNTLTLSKDYEYKTGDSTTGITINNQITIDGNGHTINLNNEIGQLFTINADNVMIKNLNIINSNLQTALTGAITWNGAYGQLINCHFTNGTIKIANNGGSPFIYWAGSNGLIENNTFQNIVRKISVSSDGGYDLAAITSAGTNLEIKYCNFTNLTEIACISCTQVSYENHIYGCEFNSISGTAIGGRRSNFYVENCYIHNSETGSYSESSLIFARSVFYVINTTIENCTGSRIFRGGLQAYNSTIKNNTFNSFDTDSSMTYDNLFYNCSFTNNTITFRITPANTEFINCNIINNTGSISSNNNVHFINNTIKNNNLNNQYGIIRLSGNSAIVENNTIEENYNYQGTVIYLESADLLVNINDNQIKDNVNDTLVNREDYSNFISVDDSWVSPDGNSTNTGLTRDSPWDISTALVNTKRGGTIHLTTGTYGIGTTTLTIYQNLLGEDENTILNYTNVQLSYNFITIKNITIENGKIYSVRVDNSVINVTFKNYARTGAILNSGYSTGLKFINITIDGSHGSYQIFELPAGANVLFENITIKNINASNAYIFVYGTLFQMNIKNITVTNSTFNSFIYRSDNRVYGPTDKNMNVNLVNITDSQFSSFYYSKYNDDYSKSYTINNVNITNSNITGDIVYKYINCDFNNISLVNINNTGSNIFNFGGSGFSIDNLTLFNFTNQVNVIKSDSDVNIDKFNLENIVLTNNITLSNSATGFIFSNVTCNDDILLYLDTSRIVLSDSIFNNYSGHLLLDARSVSFNNVNFTNGKNNGLNGSAVYVLSTGSGVSFTDCGFINNSAELGAVYLVEGVSRPVFINCNFTNNTDYALYLEYSLGGGNVVTFTGITTDTLNGTYMDSYKLNGVWGNITDVVGEVWISTNISSGNARSESSPGSWETAIGIAGADCVFHFVVDGAVFDCSGSFYEILDNNWIFYGNNTILFLLKTF